ncbi:uncharacterized protein [Penaeus vannamei]|uniref:uncharacterized protein n=1 Tax=Penaeus vannamei TaxID=6689 RepID=UPI00387F7A0B
MSLNMKSLVLWTALSLLAISEGLEPDLPVKACQEEFSSVSLTSTRLQVSTVVSTVTLLDVVPTYVSLTTTDCVPYLITHTETVSQYQAPQLAYSTHYVTDLKITEKNRAYTSSYRSHLYAQVPVTQIGIKSRHAMSEHSSLLKQLAITIKHVTQVVGTTTATAVSTASLVKTVTASTTATQTYTQVDVFTSVTYLPVYLTTTMTNAWPILKTVYQIPVTQISIKSRHAMSEHSSPLKQLAITISMSLNMKSLLLWTAFSLLAISEGLEPDLPVKACQEEFSSVSLTSTRLQVSTVVSTVTLLEVVPTYVSVTTTDCVPYAITHTETVSQYQAPQLAYSTLYVTDLKITEKNRAYTYTSYQQETISITYSATHLEEHVTQVVGTTTATAVSTASVVKTVTASTTATQTYTQVDVFTSVTYLPIYLTTTMTNAWPILKTVYQTEYIKEAVDYVTMVIETATVYHFPVTQIGIKSRHAMSEHSSPLKQFAITISMSLNMKSLVLWTALSLLATSEGLEPDLPVKACQEEFSSVSLTSTRLQVSTVVSTVTLLDVVPTYVSVTTTDLYLTTTMTNAWPILKTVYQTEYIKEAVDYVTTVIETSTVYRDCNVGYGY